MCAAQIGQRLSKSEPTFGNGSQIIQFLLGNIIRHQMLQKKQIKSPAFEISIFCHLQNIDEGIILILPENRVQQRSVSFVRIPLNIPSAQIGQRLSESALLWILQKNLHMQHFEMEQLIGLEMKDDIQQASVQIGLLPNCNVPTQ